MFQYGRKHYCDGVHRFNTEELHMFWSMFKRKYWGNVEGDIWEANNKAASENSGEMTAIYTGESGRVIYLYRTQDCSYTIFYSQEDIDNGQFESVKRQLTENSRGRRRTMSLFG